MIVVRSFLQHLLYVVRSQTFHGRIALLFHHGDALHFFLVALIEDVDFRRVVLITAHHFVHHLLALFLIVDLLSSFQLLIGVDSVGDRVPIFFVCQMHLLLL